MPAGFHQQHPQHMQPAQHLQQQLQHPQLGLDQQQLMSRQQSGQAPLPGGCANYLCKRQELPHKSCKVHTTISSHVSSGLSRFWQGFGTKSAMKA
jgi:hypothetical protein